MTSARWVLFAAATAVMGCVSSPPPPPTYVMRPGDVPMVVRWQQFCEQAKSVSQASWLAASRGGDGWELVSMYSGVLCYKRPVPADPAPSFTPPEPTSTPPPEMLGAAPTSPPSRAMSPVPSVIEPGF